jgi:hypothetical protein
MNLLQKAMEYYTIHCRDSAFCIATGYVLEGRGPIPCRGKRFSLFHSVQTSSEAHPTSYPVRTGDLFLEVHWSGREADS